MPSDCSLPPNLARTLSRRESILDELLSHYTEAQETLWSGGGISAGGERLPLMSAAWTRHYRELERVLRLMRDDPARRYDDGHRYKQLYWHVSHWWLRVEWVQRPRIRNLGQGRQVVAGYTLRPTRHRDVRPELARSGLGLVDTLYNRFEPFVPEEIRKSHLPGDEALERRAAVA